MDHIKAKLFKHKKKTITLDELMKIFQGINCYEEFYQEVQQLIEEEILDGVVASGTNARQKALFNKYRLKKSAIEVEKALIINEKIYRLHPSISLEYYFKKELKIFKEEEVYIDRINAYLKANDLPKSMLMPELSYALVGDEKWIENGIGMKVLKHLALWTRIKPIKEADPMAFAVNKKLVSKKIQRHLIVENKTPFLQLMNVIEESNYNTIIYGQGWKITGGIDMFVRQYPFGDKHEFYYFGDIDNEGIAIFLNLNQRKAIKPALEFYGNLFTKPWSKGKLNQRYDEVKVKQFIKSLTKHTKGQALSPQGEYILTMLTEGCYQPQEILSRIEIEEIVRQGVKDD